EERQRRLIECLCNCTVLCKKIVNDELRSGRPSTRITPDNIQRVLQMIVADQRMSLRMFARPFIELFRLTLKINNH
ncbi:hypothetical protein C0J52_23574, partial [Blattella germanica]